VEKEKNYEYAASIAGLHRVNHKNSLIIHFHFHKFFPIIIIIIEPNDLSINFFSSAQYRNVESQDNHQLNGQNETLSQT
jgi:hypothetical protein